MTDYDYPGHGLGLVNAGGMGSVESSVADH